MNSGKSLLHQLDMFGYSKMYIRELLEMFGCNVVVREEGFPLYDMEVVGADKSISTISVNSDTDIANTGTISVVLSRMINGREIPSGLLQTKGEYYVFKVYGTPGAFCIDTEKLLKMYKDGKYQEIRADDNDSNTKVAVFDRQFLLDSCEKIVK